MKIGSNTYEPHRAPQGALQTGTSSPHLHLPPRMATNPHPSTNMPQVIKIFIPEDDINPEPPTCICQVHNHATANVLMQQDFDKTSQSTADTIFQEDDSDADHFMIETSTGTYHWWII